MSDIDMQVGEMFHCTWNADPKTLGKSMDFRSKQTRLYMMRYDNRVDPDPVVAKTHRPA
ncbi:MAG: hypothetical protein ACM3ON_08100 [Chloroflexota bacterium]